MFKKKETCGSCACFLPYFIVFEERERQKGISPETIDAILSDPENPHRLELVCAINFSVKKEDTPACKDLLKRGNSQLTWQELNQNRKEQSNVKMRKLKIAVSLTALCVSIGTLLIKLLFGI